jgi:ribosomal protein S27E
MKRQMTEEDLRDKGMPFKCNNCGQKPMLDDVIKHGAECQVCGDEVITYTLEAAKLIRQLLAVPTARVPPVDSVHLLPHPTDVRLDLHRVRPEDNWQFMLRVNNVVFTIGPECKTLQEAQDIRTAFKKALFDLQCTFINAN